MSAWCLTDVLANLADRAAEICCRLAEMMENPVGDDDTEGMGCGEVVIGRRCFNRDTSSADETQFPV